MIHARGLVLLLTVMNEPVDIEVVRTEALRKLGRNVVNFSKIEVAFKYLLSVSQFEGSEKTISDQLLRKQTILRKQTLGKLVREFSKNILDDASQSAKSHELRHLNLTQLRQVILTNFGR